MKKFENAVTRFTVICILIIIAVIFAAGVSFSYARVSGNITGQKPETARAAFERIAGEFEKIVNF